MQAEYIIFLLKTYVQFSINCRLKPTLLVVVFGVSTPYLPLQPQIVPCLVTQKHQTCSWWLSIHTVLFPTLPTAMPLLMQPPLTRCLYLLFRVGAKWGHVLQGAFCKPRCYYSTPLCAVMGP